MDRSQNMLVLLKYSHKRRTYRKKYIFSRWRSLVPKMHEKYSSTWIAVEICWFGRNCAINTNDIWKVMFSRWGPKVPKINVNHWGTSFWVEILWLKYLPKIQEKVNFFKIPAGDTENAIKANDIGKSLFFKLAAEGTANKWKQFTDFALKRNMFVWLKFSHNCWRYREKSVFSRWRPVEPKIHENHLTLRGASGVSKVL